MVDNKEFWKQLELGKWKATVVQKDVSRLLSKTISLLLVFVTYCIVGQIFLSNLDFPLTDFFAPASLLLTVFLSMYAMSLGFYSYFLQRRAGPEIITCKGLNKKDGVEIAVTIINKDNVPAVIRFAGLFAIKDMKGLKVRIKSRFTHLPCIYEVDNVPFFFSWKIIEPGKCIAIGDADLRRAMAELFNKLAKITDSKDAYIALLFGDEGFDITNPNSISANMLGGCKFGKIEEWLNYANGKEPFGYTIYSRTIDGIKETVVDIPPDIIDADGEIFMKLENIEKILTEIKNNRKIEKRK